MALALGLVETKGLIAAIEAADAMAKASNVKLVGKEKTNPALITLKVVGDVAAVKASVEAGAAAAARIGVVVSTHIIPQPDVQLGELYPEILNELPFTVEPDTTGTGLAAEDSTDIPEPEFISEIVEVTADEVEERDMPPITEVASDSSFTEHFEQENIELNESDDSSLHDQVSEQSNDFEVSYIEDSQIPVEDYSIEELEDQPLTNELAFPDNDEFPDNGFEDLFSQADREENKKNAQRSVDSQPQSALSGDTWDDDGRAVDIKTDAIIASDEEMNELTKKPLDTLNVHELRRLARQTTDFPIQGREISKANRQELLYYFKSLK